MKQYFWILATLYLLGFIVFAFFISNVIGTNEVGFIITLTVFSMFGIGGSFWIINYGKKQYEIKGNT